MQVTREDLNPCTIKFAVVGDAEQVQEGFNRAYKQLAKKVKLPGFRPGTAPKHLLKSALSPEDVKEAAAENIVRELYKQLLKDQDITPEPTVSPQVSVGVIEEDPGKIEFTVKVPLPPQVEMGEVKGLKVEQQPIEVTDEEVDYHIDELRRGRSTREAVTDRGVTEGDYCVLGITTEGDKEESRTFMTVAGKTFPELDAALMGMKVEEMKNLTLTFPAGFQDKDWAGKTLACKLSLNSITAAKLPELDEEFAKALKSESVEDLRTRLRELIQNAKDEAAREIMTEQLLDALLEKSTVHVPDAMWESIAERRLIEVVQEQRQKGKTLEEYAKENGMTIEELAEAWREKAQMHVRRALLVREVFAKEKMSLNNADLNKELVMMASEYEVKPEEMLNMLKKNEAVEELHFRAISRKVADFLIEHADTAAPATGSKKKVPAGAKA